MNYKAADKVLTFECKPCDYKAENITHDHYVTLVKNHDGCKTISK